MPKLTDEERKKRDAESRRKYQASPAGKKKHAESQRKYRAANKEKVQASLAKWRAADRLKERSAGSIWRAANRERHLANKARYLERNREAILARRRANRLKENEANTARRRQWSKDNPEKAAESHRSTYLKRRDAHLARSRRDWLKRSPISNAKARDLMKRAREALPVSLPPDVKEEIVAAVVCAVFEGKVLRTFTAKDVKQFLKKHNREFSDWAVSLDDVLTPDGATRGTLMGIY